ncbi:Acyltransferase LovD [Vanrija pseudolonga]|uniref:Acyltransferase LovD n=1 Tax=Vanrija pseudolonga TaxID=143232 RepID=A0AAF1BKQ5_9TREE|nr:Acyltransferase LovD [Vanrija pseudolonga]
MTSGPTAPAPHLTPKGKAALDALLHAEVDSRLVPALTFGATTADGEIYFAYAGERVLGEPDKGQVDAETVMSYHSCTKLMTTVAVLQLVDAGVLSLSDPAVVEKYAPELYAVPILEGYDESGKAILKKRTQPLTLTHLLTHTSGMTYAFINANTARWVKENKLPGYFEHEAGLAGFVVPLAFEPGSSWTYGMGIDWAGIIVERASGQTLEEYMSANIWQPLGLKSMTFLPGQDHFDRLQKVQTRDASGALVPSEPLRPICPNPSIRQLAGGGGVMGTPRDYLRFLRGILASQNPTPSADNPALFSPQAFNTLFTNALPPRDVTPVYASLEKVTTMQSYHDSAHTANNAQSLGHSVGLVLNFEDSVHGRKAGSGCWDGAAKSQYWLDPKTGIAGICFTQLLTPNPEPFMGTYNRFERALYDALE